MNVHVHLRGPKLLDNAVEVVGYGNQSMESVIKAAACMSQKRECWRPVNRPILRPVYGTENRRHGV